MNINSINNPFTSIIKTETEKPAKPGFDNIFSDLIKDVNKSQMESAKTIENFVAGNGAELHEVMIAGEKAKTSLDLLMEIRNKTLDMYKELTRMQM